MKVILIAIFVVAAILGAIALQVQIYRDCGWDAFWAGKNARTLWAIGACENGEIRL